MKSVLISVALTALTCLLASRRGANITRKVWVVAALTCLGGVLADYIFGYRVGMWAYTHHIYWSVDYWYLIVPAWFVLGVWFQALWWLVSDVRFTVPVLGLAGLNSMGKLVVVTGLAAGISEGIGYIRHCWTYSAPLWVLITGWFLLTYLVCVLPRNVMSLRRRNVKETVSA